MTVNIEYKLGEIDGKVDALLSHARRLEDRMEKRVASLEMFRWKAAGAMAVALVVVGLWAKHGG